MFGEVGLQKEVSEYSNILCFPALRHPRHHEERDLGGV